MTEDEKIVKWHHWLNGHECDQTNIRNSERQRSHNCAAVYGAAKTGTRLSDSTELNFSVIYTLGRKTNPINNDNNSNHIIRHYPFSYIKYYKNYLFNCSTAISVCILHFWLMITWNLRCSADFPWILTRTHHFLILMPCFSMTQHCLNLEHKSKCYSKEIKRKSA